jgi:hypothetical protein
MKKENKELKGQKEEAENRQVTPEQYLEQISADKDLQSLLHFC